MSAEVMFRADFRPVAAETLSEHTGRVQSLSSSGCTILTRCQSEPGAEIELRLYLPGGAWPIRVDHAKVTWGYWDSFTVEFLSLPACDQERLEDYLAEASAPAAV
ncbi:MAG: PilZ domain-containing protein [Nitrospira sp.]